ncbi:MAG: hypothetical protein JXA72_10690 [Bacteroidales bacterium]|nr:hypothetical protein [Bacteroidales bacterium]
MRITIIITAFVWFFLNETIQAKEYNILNYGAIPDTAVLSTQAIQKAIDECTANGGGRVIIPSGRYKTGTIVIKSNVGIYLEHGAVLYGSKNLADYLPLKPEYVSLRTQEATVQLIYAENARNISITGYGEIDGQGSSFKKMSWNDEGITRPHLLRFITCAHVNVENLTLRNSGCWMQHYLACEEVQLRGLRIFNRNNFNNDGIDIDGCRNVTISDILSDSDDDGITLKSTSPKPCENITITNCVISSRCNAIKLGTETNGGFRNVAISNCVIKPSQMLAPSFYGNTLGTSGISLEIVDGGTMQGVTINNIRIEGTESPIFIRLANRGRPYKKDLEIIHTGTLQDVSISQVRIYNAGNTGCSITGLPGSPVTNIRMGNICFEQAGGRTAEDINREIPEMPKDYPEATMFGPLPAYGFFIRHARNISFSEMEFAFQKDDPRPALYLNDVDSSRFTGMVMESTPETPGNVFLENTGNILIQGSSVMGPSNCFVYLKGEQNRKISVANNVLGSETKAYKSASPRNDVYECGNLKR